MSAPESLPINLPPVVSAIESPTPGTVWHVGNGVTITFLGLADVFHVRLSFDAGQSFMQIGDVPGNPRPPQGYSLPYTVPNHLTTQALVRVDAINTVNGVQQRATRDSGLFTIAAHK